MIGQKHKSADALAALKAPERPFLTPRAASFSAASETPVENSKIEDAGSTTEEPALDSGSASSVMSPYEDPVPAVGADDLDTPMNHAASLETVEALAAEDPDFAETLSEVSKEWPSPTTEDSSQHVRTWVSPIIAEYERWQVVKNNLRAMELIPRSPFVPRTFLEWLNHRFGMKDLNIKELCRRIKAFEAVVALGSDRIRIMKAFNGKKFDDGNSGVLALETTWTPWNKPNSGRLQAPWPCYQEMKEEGDERNTSGFGRFPALPRVVTNETVNYKHRAVLITTPFDRVWPLPPAEMVDDGVGDSDDAIAEALLGKGLLSAIDE
ncbi:MAG: hypothetical protein Q9191_001763 [Dirinaria sp. TL-2023a]